MTEPARGRFITLEGGEGAGKSVQAKRLERNLKEIGLEVVRTREPGGSPGAEALREAILSGFAAPFGPEGEALLFAAARIDHLDKTILPALAGGAWVVCDRFADFHPRLSRRGGESAAGLHRPPRASHRRREQARPDAHSGYSSRGRPGAGRQAAGQRQRGGPLRGGRPRFSPDAAPSVPRHRRRGARALRGH